MAVYKRGDIWWMDIVIKGKRQRVSAETTDKREAELKEAQLRKRLMDGVVNSVKPSDVTEDITVGQAFERVYNEVWSRQKSQRTTLSTIKVISAIVGENTPLVELNNSQAIASLKQGLFDRGNSESSVNRKLSAVHIVLNQAAYYWKIIPYVAPMKREKESLGRIYVMTKEDEQKIIKEAGAFGLYVHLLFVTLFDTGMRLTEVLELRWSEVNFDNKVIHIWVNKMDHPRSVPMTNRLFNLLSSSWGAIKEVSGHSEKVLNGLTFNRIQYVWSIIKEKVGNPDPDFVIHAIRHTFASRLVERGVPLYTVQKLLGHKSIHTTERYSYLQDETMRDAIKVYQTSDNPSASE